MFRPGILKLAFALGPAVFATLSLATFAPARAAAAPAPAAAGHLSLEDALRTAEETSPLLRRARAERDRSPRATWARRVLLPSNPVIAGGAGPRREGPPANILSERGLQYFVHAEQTVEIGGQRSARRAVVSRALHTAELRVQVARAETRARVRAAYVGTQLALGDGGRGHPARGAGDEAA